MFTADQIKQDMTVIGTQGRHIGTVDHVRDYAIGLYREGFADDLHHFVSLAAVMKIDIEGYDLAIQIGDNPDDSSLRISRLFTLRRRVSAAPSLVERFGIPAHPSELAHYPMLIATHVPWGNEIQFTGPDGEQCQVPISGSLHMNSSIGLLEALLGGAGAIAMPEYFIWEALEEGRLVELFPEWTIPSAPICVVTWPSG